MKSRSKKVRKLKNRRSKVVRRKNKNKKRKYSRRFGEPKNGEQSTEGQKEEVSKKEEPKDPKIDQQIKEVADMYNYIIQLGDKLQKNLLDFNILIFKPDKKNDVDIKVDIKRYIEESKFEGCLDDPYKKALGLDVNSEIKKSSNNNIKNLGQIFAKYYCEHSKKLSTYKINDHRTITYDKITDGAFSINKCLNEKIDNDILSMYKIENNGITTFRFGTPLDEFKYTYGSKAGIISKKKDPDYGTFNHIIEKVGDNKSIISISLLHLLKFKIIGSQESKQKKITDAENDFNKKQQNNDENARYYTVFFPIGKKTTIIGSTKDLNEKQPIDDKNLKIVQCFNKIKQYTPPPYADAKKQFRAIVKIAKFYKDVGKDYFTLIYHCKSGKDRTSVFDAIVQATIYHFIDQSSITSSIKDYKHSIKGSDYLQIKILSRKFLIYGLIITYKSTGIVGMKLSTTYGSIPVGNYLFESNEYDHGVLDTENNPCDKSKETECENAFKEELEKEKTLFIGKSGWI